MLTFLLYLLRIIFLFSAFHWVKYYCSYKNWGKNIALLIINITLAKFNIALLMNNIALLKFYIPLSIVYKALFILYIDLLKIYIGLFTIHIDLFKAYIVVFKVYIVHLIFYYSILNDRSAYYSRGPIIT